MKSCWKVLGFLGAAGGRGAESRLAMGPKGEGTRLGKAKGRTTTSLKEGISFVHLCEYI